MGARPQSLASLSAGILGAQQDHYTAPVGGRHSGYSWEDDLEDEPEIITAAEWRELAHIGRGKTDLIGEALDMAEYDDDDDDDEAGYIGYADIIGALHAAECGARLTPKQRKAIRKAKRGMKKATRRANESDISEADLALAMRQANKPIVRTETENVLRVLNMNLNTITVGAGATNSFAVVVQESMRIERMFLYPVGGSYDNLWVGDIFCGRQTNSVIPGNEEPMIVYSATAVNSGIEGFTVNFGLTLRIMIRNGTGVPVVVGGKIKGRTLTS